LDRELYEFDLDKIYEFLKLSTKKHADKAYISKNRSVVILVEETSTARKEDIDKLAETLRTIKEDERFMKIFRLEDATEKIKFILTLHAKRSEELISKQLLSRGKRLGVTVLTTSCEEDFRNKLRSMDILE
jgi:DUF438 domain-containing protein